MVLLCPLLQKMALRKLLPIANAKGRSVTGRMVANFTRDPSLPLLVLSRHYWLGQSVCSALVSDIDPFGNSEGVVYFDSQVSYSALDLCVSKQELHRTEIAGPSVDQGRLSPTQ